MKPTRHDTRKRCVYAGKENCLVFGSMSPAFSVFVDNQELYFESFMMIASE